MFKRTLNLFQQDMMVTVRNKFHLVILALAILMVLIVNFVIPEEVKFTPDEIFLDNTNGDVIQRYLITEGLDRERFVTSEEELYQRLEENSNTLGVIAEGSLENTIFTVIGQGNESETSFNLLDASLASIIDHIEGTTTRTNHRVEYLREKSETVPFNKKMIPILMLTEVVLLGFLLISVMVFQEKEEGSVRAYRVSPAGTLEYIISKTGANLVLALLYAVVLIVFTVGFAVNYLNLLLIAALANILMTLVGLAISVFFKNLEEFIFVAILVMSVIALPLVSYLTPSFAPSFITWLPSYPVLFGLKEVLFPTGREGFISSLNWMLLGEGLLFLVISYWAVKKKLMKEGK